MLRRARTAALKAQNSMMATPVATFCKVRGR